MNAVKFLLFYSFLLTACSTPNPSLISAPSISKYSLSKEANGLSMAVDPYFDKGRVERELGRELSDGILPIFVVVENHTSTTYLLEKAQFTLHSAQSKTEGLVPIKPPPISRSKTEIGSAIVVELGALALAPIVMLPALAVSFNEHDTRSYAAYNIWLNEFPDKTVFPGESVSGFVYLPTETVNSYTTADDKELHVVIKDTKTGSTTTFLFPLSLSQHKPDSK